AQPGAGGLRSHSCFERAVADRGRDPGTRIDHLDGREPVLAADGHANLASVGGRLERILHEVDEDLLRLARVAAHLERVSRRYQPQVARAGETFVQGDDAAAELAQIDGLLHERHEWTREVEELVENRSHPVHLDLQEPESLPGAGRIRL